MNNNQESFVILCIDTVENNVSSGRFYYSDLSREHTFTGLDRFLLTVDALLDGEELAGFSEADLICQQGKIATFKVQILFRRNGSWQGSITWLETRHEEMFRSTLELMSIINQAMGPAQKQRMCPSSLKLAK